MGPNENWMSEVEYQLRNMRDQSVGQSINQLAVQAQINYPTQVSEPKPASTTANQDSQPDGNDWFYIRLTDVALVQNEYRYSWRQVVKVNRSGNTGYEWVDTGLFGTYAYMPACGINNQNLTPGTASRYLARWNPDTQQVFF